MQSEVRSEYLKLRKTLPDIFEENIDKVYSFCKEQVKNGKRHITAL